MHCLENNGDFLFRLRCKAFTIYDNEGKKINLNAAISDATENTPVSFTANFKTGGEYKPIRICAVRKTADDILKSQKRIHRNESKKQKEYSKEAKSMNDYIVVVTSLPENITADKILGLYRYHWQIELYFKRLKSLMELGNLPNKNKDSIMAWLNGKMLCALLVELLLAKVDFPPKASDKSI
ncbi:hypothetical protein FACS1894188_05360 [Clostridia bacterium]|nr:hypothetical protein FACS1894188_05360 [Clostridia bacterium]